jgi:hypothetical protein
MFWKPRIYALQEGGGIENENKMGMTILSAWSVLLIRPHVRGDETNYK